MSDEHKRYMIELGGMYANTSGCYYTLTPEHLYLHDKKKLHKSKILIRFGTPDKEEFSVSGDGGKTWDISLSDGLLALKVSQIKERMQP